MIRSPELVKGFVAIDSTPYGEYYLKSDLWWLRQIEWMAKLFPEKWLKSVMAKQNAATETGRSNMAAMIDGYGKLELCHLMGIGYAGFLEDNRVCEIPCPVLLIVGEKDHTGKVKAYKIMGFITDLKQAAFDKNYRKHQIRMQESNTHDKTSIWEYKYISAMWEHC